MSGSELIPDTGDNGAKPSIVTMQGQQILQLYRIISFNNRPMILDEVRYPHYVPLTKERFDRMAHNMLNGPTRSRVSDVFANVINTAPDLSHNSHLILFGQREMVLDQECRAVVWDSRALAVIGYTPEDCVWRSPFPQLKPAEDTEPIEFIMQLAGGDEGLYDDIMQSLAPMIMDRKPDGVIWWIGAGANGKSTLMDALYLLFPGQLSSLTIKKITDERDTPNLNGNLANIVKESSEGRIDDTEKYKSIGTHEDLTVHRFHSQEPLTVKGNMHHIFSGNLIPVFNDKGYSARRRTYIIPFTQEFVSDPTFEERTFTPEFFSHLIAEMCKYAVRLRDQGYRYKWSDKTTGAKLDYDTEANTAENYVSELINDGVVGFDNFSSVRIDYENWCREEGQVPLGVGNMRRAILGAGFERMSVRLPNTVTKAYRLPNFREDDLQVLSMGRPGLYTVPGFSKCQPVETPNFDPQPFSTSIIGDKW